MSSKAIGMRSPVRRRSLSQKSLRKVRLPSEAMVLLVTNPKGNCCDTRDPLKRYPRDATHAATIDGEMLSSPSSRTSSISSGV